MSFVFLFFRAPCFDRICRGGARHAKTPCWEKQWRTAALVVIGDVLRERSRIGHVERTVNVPQARCLLANAMLATYTDACTDCEEVLTTTSTIEIGSHFSCFMLSSVLNVFFLLFSRQHTSLLNVQWLCDELPSIYSCLICVRCRFFCTFQSMASSTNQTHIHPTDAWDES